MRKLLLTATLGLLLLAPAALARDQERHLDSERRDRLEDRREDRRDQRRLHRAAARLDAIGVVVGPRQPRHDVLSCYTNPRQHSRNATQSHYPYKTKPRDRHDLEAQRITPGSDLLSHTVTHAVPSAEEGLTTVFEMGTGVSPPL
jgi:hypothetical protein